MTDTYSPSTVSIQKTEQASPVISRVLDLDNTETFLVQAILLHRESLKQEAWPWVLPDFSVVVVNPVPVYSDSRQLLGFAVVQADERRVSADIRIARDCPERLEIETKSQPLWAAFEADTIEYQVHNGRFLGSRVAIRSVELTHTRPFDPLIQPLGEVVL